MVFVVKLHRWQTSDDMGIDWGWEDGTFVLSLFSRDDVIKWKHFPRYWYRWLVNSPHKGQWLGALMFSLICTWINGWVNTREPGDLRRHRAHYYVTVIHAASVVDTFASYNLRRVFQWCQQKLQIQNGVLLDAVVLMTHENCGLIAKKIECFNPWKPQWSLAKCDINP